MKLWIFLLSMLTTTIGARADVVPPCVAQDAAAVATTTCAIGNKAFTFGGFKNGTGVPIGFFPDVGDSGFTLTGFTDVSDPSGFVFYELPFSAATLSGTSTIIGLATQLSGPVLSG